MRHFVRFIFIDPVFGNQPRQKGAIDAARHIMAGGYRRKGARVVIEADGVIKSRQLRRHFAEAAHALGAVMEPPGGPQLEGRIDAGERRQFTGVARLVEGE